MTSQTVVDIQCVSKQYDSAIILKDISLQIEQGQFFGLLGSNGAGKSTLINILAGLAKPDRGRVSIMGYDVQADYRQARRIMGLVPQELVDEPFFQIRQLLEIQSGYFGIRNNGQWIDELLHEMLLTDKADQVISTLSGGMKRRVLIAMALVHKPLIVILDEPTAGVDVNMRRSLWGFIERLQKRGHTIILTTHYLEEAEQLCDHIAIIDKGEILKVQNKKTLLNTNGDKSLEQVFIDLVGGFE